MLDRVFYEQFTIRRALLWGRSEVSRCASESDHIRPADASVGLKPGGQMLGARHQNKAAPHRAEKCCCGTVRLCRQLVHALMARLRGGVLGPIQAGVWPGRLRKSSSQATEGLMTEPDWGHRWTVREDTHGGSEVRRVYAYFPDDYFHSVSGCNLKSPLIKFLSAFTFTTDACLTRGQKLLLHF